MKGLLLLLSLSLICSPLAASSQLGALLSSLDPSSVSQALALYELYPETNEGKEALHRAMQLLAAEAQIPKGVSEKLAPLVLWANRSKAESLSEEQLALVERIASLLPNRRLRGYQANSFEELLELSAEEVDVGKALFLSDHSSSKEEMRRYMAKLDLMAIQVLARVGFDASAREKIEALNQYLFQELHIRFPPHSLYAKDVDVYTFLSSVLDNHLGVCLGVSNLYLALAQRMGLVLEPVTPPGHIYLRYANGEELINIETTARGIHLPTEEYLGVTLGELPPRTYLEVLGMTQVNAASLMLGKGEYQKAALLYDRAAPFLQNDPFISELRGFAHLLSGNEEGLDWLLHAQEMAEEQPLASRRLAEDYLQGHVNLEGISMIFLEVDETRASILRKQEALLELLEEYPHFRSGLLSLAIGYLQLGRVKDALVPLLKFHELDPENVEVEYYLTVLFAQRFHFEEAWKHLRLAEALTQRKGFTPKILKILRKKLAIKCPEC